MARTVTLLQLRTWARQLADVESDPNITDAELTALANRHTTEVWDALVDAGSPDYYAATTTITTVAGTTTYALAADFRNLSEVYVQESTSRLRPLTPMGNIGRGRYKAPTAAWTVTVEYIPTAPTLALDADTFDGVSGWEELIANLMARDVMVKRESDPSVVLASIGALQARIRSRARNRDRGNPKRITDLDEVHDAWPFEFQNTRLACYRLRAGNLELYEHFWGLP